MIFFRSEFHDFRRLRKSIVSIRGMLQMAADRQMDWHIPLLSYTVLYFTTEKRKRQCSHGTKNCWMKNTNLQKYSSKETKFPADNATYFETISKIQISWNGKIDRQSVEKNLTTGRYNQTDRQIDKPSVGLILKPTGTQKDYKESRVIKKDC